MSVGRLPRAKLSAHISDKPCPGVPAAVEPGVPDAGAVVEDNASCDAMSAFCCRSSNMAPRAGGVKSCGAAGDAFVGEVGGAALRCICGCGIATCVSPEEAAVREAGGCVASIPEAAAPSTGDVFRASDTPVNSDVTGEPGAAGASAAAGDVSAGGLSTAAVVVTGGDVAAAVGHGASCWCCCCFRHFACLSAKAAASAITSSATIA